ncbi:Nitric oxide synthase, brain, partial [Halocaridina rubra]
LSDIHGQSVVSCEIVANNKLYQQNDKWYREIIIKTNQDSSCSLDYEPGDHIGVFPANNPELVNGILPRLKNIANSDTPIQIMVQTQTGNQSDWKPHPRLPVASIRTLLSRYLDITSPPSQALLQLMADAASENNQAGRLQYLAKNESEYRQWKQWNRPNLLEVLKEFPSVRMDVGVMLCRLPLLLPRLYSISSSPLQQFGHLTLTVASFSFKTRGGKGPVHQGVCTSYLKSLRAGDTIEIFHKSAQEFHLPDAEKAVPILLLGAGSGVAPLRGFWQHCYHKGMPCDMTLYYGCQTRASDLYADEKVNMCKAKVLTEAYLALSKDPKIPKV